MRKSFTLIELLVVIAIIAILASMLMPALSKARAKARCIDCVSRQKQAVLMLMIYANDYEDMSPLDCGVAYTSLATPDSDCYWSNGLHYITCNRFGLKYGPRDAVRCKSREKDLATWPLEDQVSWNVFGKCALQDSTITTALELGNCLATSPYINCVILTAVKNPCSLISYADAAEVESGRSVFNFYAAWGPDTGYAIAMNHNGKTNAMFYDGHVESAHPNKWHYVKNGYYFLGGYLTDSNTKVNY